MMKSGEELRLSVRKRPGMYIGDVYAFGLSNLLETFLLVGFVAAKEGRVREVSVSLGAEGSCRVSVDGWLWPVSPAASPFAEVEQWFTIHDVDWRLVPHSLGSLVGGPKGSFGIVSALSSSLGVIAWDGGRTWQQHFREGLSLSAPLLDVPGVSQGTSTSGMQVTFIPDATLFEPPRRFSVEALAQRVSAFSALHAGITWRFRDEASGREECFRRERGLADLCAELSAPSRPVHEPWSFEGEAGTTQVRLALQWGEGPGLGVVSWANINRCSRGGSHHDGLHQGLRKALRARMRARGPQQEPLSFPDVALSARLTVVLDLTVPQAVWYGPTKEKLANPEVKGDVARLVSTWVEQALASDPDLESRVLMLASASRESVMGEGKA